MNYLFNNICLFKMAWVNTLLRCRYVTRTTYSNVYPTHVFREACCKWRSGGKGWWVVTKLCGRKEWREGKNDESVIPINTGRIMYRYLKWNILIKASISWKLRKIRYLFSCFVCNIYCIYFTTLIKYIRAPAFSWIQRRNKRKRWLYEWRMLYPAVWCSSDAAMTTTVTSGKRSRKRGR